MAKKKYNPEYIANAKKLTDDILYTNNENSGFTQVCLSIQDAVCAAATVFGNSSDQEVDKMRHFIQEISLLVVRNYTIHMKIKKGE